MADGLILIVDDREENLLYLRTLLRAAGYQSISCQHGALALESARQRPPLLIISDLLMPVMDGYTLLRHWKADPRLRSIPFMVYTSTYIGPADRKLADDMGADAFVTKPAEPQVLLAKISEVMSRPVASARFADAEAADEEAHLQQYSEALIRKLETKTRELEDLNHELQDSRERYLLLLNSTAEGIYGLDVNGICTFCNTAASRMLGYEDPAQLVGWSAHAQHHHRRADGAAYLPCDCPVHSRPGTGEVAHRDDEIFVRRDGSEFPVEYWSYPVRKGGEVVGAVVTFLDISERRSLQAQFLQAQKMEAVGRLAGGVAHDFNNALQVIMICGELLAERDMPADMQGYVTEILAAGERAASLTRRLLAFSRRQLLHPVVLNLNAVVRDLKDMLRRMIGEDVSLSLVFDPNIRSIRSDVSQIEQIVMNLAVNARDAMPRGGELHIDTANAVLTEADCARIPKSRPGNYVVLKVRDTGTGMDAATLARIFEPFFTTKEPGKGTGLGLSTVYSIVEQSEGFIQVVSAPGQGAEFTLYFPSVAGVAPGRVEARIVAAARGGSEAVLLVEDEEALRTLVAKALRENGYQVMEARDGRSGVELARAAGRLDLLVTDVILPDISGPEVVDAVRGAHPGSRILYISGYSDEYIERISLPGERSAVLEKPFAVSTFLARVRAALDEPTAVQANPPPG